MQFPTLNRCSPGSKEKGKSREIFVADFETTTTPDDCRVWGWGIVPVREDVTPADVEMGSTIDLFVRHLCRQDTIVYFHNLAFDGSFILDHILRHDYVYVEEYPKRGEFECLISNTGKFYSIKVKWKSGGSTEFRDSLKKLPMSVRGIAKAFKLPLSKLEIDYDAPRSPTHRLTDEERDYIAADVVIVARALALSLNQGMKKLTVGADSLAEYKRLVGDKMFTRTFPVLAEAMDADIRKAYRGGWTYCDPRTQGRIVGPGAVYDVNSLYPSVMAYELLPYGVPVWFDGAPSPTEDFPLFIVSITFLAKLKPNHLPCIQIKGNSMFGSTEYLSEVNDATTLSVSNVDLEMWEKHYDLNILAYNGGWAFKGAYGFFDEYIEKWSAIKANSEGGLRAIAKLHLNSLYGKFATNPNVTGKYPVLDNNRLALVMGPSETRDPVYTAMGVFITAYARRVTLTAAQANYEHFAYADTDSIHLLTPASPVGVTVDAHALGAWKREYYFQGALFWRAKSYSEKEFDGTMHTHIAGLPESVAREATFDDYFTGKIFHGKLLPRRVPGGIVLAETTFTLK